MIALQGFPTPIVKSEPRRKMGVPLEKMQVSLTNGLISVKKLNGDSRQAIPTEMSENTWNLIRHTDNQTILDIERRRTRNQKKP